MNSRGDAQASSGPVEGSGRIRIALRVKPGARRPRMGGRHDGPLGAALVIAVTAPAVDGRANAAVISALAAALQLKSRSIEVVSGARGRDKIVQVAVPDEHDHARVSARLDRLLAGASTTKT